MLPVHCKVLAIKFRAKVLRFYEQNREEFAKGYFSKELLQAINAIEAYEPDFIHPGLLIAQELTDELEWQRFRFACIMHSKDLKASYR